VSAQSTSRDFGVLAAAYVDRLDRAREVAPQEFLREALELLCRLVTLVLTLPNTTASIRASTDEGDDVERLLEAGLEDFLGTSGAYWTVPPLLESNVEALPLASIGSIAEDLAEIYGALVPGLLAAEEGAHDVAAATWSFGFWSHWGEHALESARAIRAQLAMSGS
jgi:Domain of unknown function (DUF5063)